jgi:hypothetical protein
VVHGPAAALGRCSLDRFELLQGAMSGTGTKRVNRAAALDTPDFAVTVLPASPYEVSYVPDHHVIEFTFEGQRGVGAFGGSRRRHFDAEPWRLAFTPAGCDGFLRLEPGRRVFAAKHRAGDVLSPCATDYVEAALTVHQCRRSPIHAIGNWPAARGTRPCRDSAVQVEVTQAAQRTLRPLGQALNDAKLADYRFVLIGHTDAKGDEAYNQALSDAVPLP